MKICVTQKSFSPWQEVNKLVDSHSVSGVLDNEVANAAQEVSAMTDFE